MGQDQRDVAVQIVLEGADVMCERCGYGDGPYFTEIYDPLTGHQRTIYLCAHCQVTMYTMVLEYMREHEKVGGDVRENENQVEVRESKNRFGETNQQVSRLDSRLNINDTTNKFLLFKENR